MPEPLNSPNPSATPAANTAPPQPSAGEAEASFARIEAAIADEARKIGHSSEQYAGRLYASLKARGTAFEGAVVADARAIEQAAATEIVGFWGWCRDHLRASPLLIYFLFAFAIVFTINPAKAGLVLWGVARIGLFGWLGYWVDRIIFGRLKGLDGIQLGTAWKRRAVIVAACLIAGALIP